MVSRLDMILKELNENGNFRASLFSTSAGLLLSFQKNEDVDERVVAAMGSLLSEAALRAAEEMDLSQVISMKIKCIDDLIICRNIVLPKDKTQFILSILSKLPESNDIEKYYDQLADWAVENSKADLEQLSSI